MNVYIANFGINNYEWPVCLERSTVATMNEVNCHQYWEMGDREGYINYCLLHSKTAAGHSPTRQVASRWYNLVTIISETHHDLWIHRSGDDIWWTTSTDQPATFESGADPRGFEVIVCYKDCQPWSNKSRTGTRLLWSALHPKAIDFLSTEATLQRLSESYAAYASAMIEGADLSYWHKLPLWVAQAAAGKARRQAATVYDGKRKSAYEMAAQAFATAAGANGQIVQKILKNKDVRFLDAPELERYILDLIEMQEGLCAISSLQLQYIGESHDVQLLASLDRIDSSGHYEKGNLQVVCRFINFWKNNQSDAEFKRLLAVVRTVIGLQEV